MTSCICNKRKFTIMNKWHKKTEIDGNIKRITYSTFGPMLGAEEIKQIQNSAVFKLAIEDKIRQNQLESVYELSDNKKTKPSNYLLIKLLLIVFLIMLLSKKLYT